MFHMEQILQQEHRKLFDLYQRSVQIATEQWLANVPAQNGSYNSLPHVQGVKRHCNKILQCCNQSFEIQPQEIYVLLCSVLLHDIGKTIASENHSFYSRDIIEREWSKLGLISSQVASVIGAICWYHDLSTNNTDSDEQLHSYYHIEDFGMVRGRVIGAILYLADHMDAAFTRVMPDYLRDKVDDTEVPVANFRSQIQGIRLDPEGEMLSIVLDPNAMIPSDIGQYTFKEERIQEKFKVTFEPYNHHLSHDATYTVQKKNKVLNFPYQNPLQSFLIERIEHRFSQSIAEHHSIENGVYQARRMCDMDISQRLGSYGCAQARKNQNIVQNHNPKNPFSIPHMPTLLTLVGDCAKNKKEIEKIRNELYILGMPITSWMIECDGLLFECSEHEIGETEQKGKAIDVKTQIAIEPLLNQFYCNDILQGILTIGSGIFLKYYHTYEELQSFLYETPEKIYKIKRAVRRLALILNYVFEDRNRAYQSKASCEDDRIPFEFFKIEYNDKLWRMCAVPSTKKTFTLSEEIDFMCKLFQNPQKQ